MENTDNISETDDNKTNEASKDSVFKIPTFVKKSITKSEKLQDQANDKVANTNSQSNLVHSKEDGQSDSSKDAASSLTKEKRPLISFQPKSLTLPSQVYKPHRPSATEYIEHYHKKDKEKHQKVFDNEPPDVAVVDVEEKKSKTSSTEEGEKQSKSGSKPNTKSTKLSYKKPEWSCPCEEDSSISYSLEVLKSGSIVDKINLINKEYFVFGRLSDCDIVLEHPSISRHHAVLQFGKPSEDDDVEFQKDGSAGFYLFDLGSTHGTKLNKVSAPSQKFYRVKVGHMMKFGGSSRMYILQGPQIDEEEESKESATELREKARAARKKEDLAKMMMGDDSDDENDENDTKTTSSRRQNDTDSGITWGMLEEAVVESDEEEEEVKEDEPTFSLQDKKDPFYVKDPNKALKNFYDKEGIEVDFECTERRSGQWNVRLELPIDTPSGNAVVADVSLTGKKKEAMNNCALEACRLLDKYGMFKQSEHHRRKVKEWEKEDFYDSDEDQYWDRTGDLDKKRQQRKTRIGVKTKTNQNQPQTYESLKKQVDELEAEISNIEKQLEKDKQAVQTKQGSKDPLEDFMMQVKSGKTLDSITRSKLKQRLFEARKESSRIVKLAEIARPASLPSLSSQSSKSMSFIGRMKGKKKGLLVPSTRPPASVYKPMETTNYLVEEEEDDVDPQNEVTSQKEEVPPATVIETKSEITEVKPTPSSSSTSPPSSFSPPSTSSHSLNRVNGAETKRIEMEQDEVEEVQIKPPHPPDPTPIVEASDKPAIRKRMFGPTLPQDLKDRLMGGGSKEEHSQTKTKKQRKKSSGNGEPTQSCSSDPNFADWMPPDNQTGDGTTSLNAKFGY